MLASFDHRFSLFENSGTQCMLIAPKQLVESTAREASRKGKAIIKSFYSYVPAGVSRYEAGQNRTRAEETCFELRGIQRLKIQAPSRAITIDMTQQFWWAPLLIRHTDHTNSIQA